MTVKEHKDLSNYKILIVEDDEMNLELITEIIKTTNINYEVVFNGAEAIDACKKIIST